jgi:hypothetical protein
MLSRFCEIDAVGGSTVIVGSKGRKEKTEKGSGSAACL